MGINWSLDWIKPQLELDYQKVVPTVTYQDIAISILLDVVSKNQKVIDSATVADLFEANITKPLVDEIILSSSFGQSQKETIESMKRISDYVIPHFKEANTYVA